MVRRWKPLQDSTYRGSVTRVRPGSAAHCTGAGAMARMMAASIPHTSTSARATDETNVKPVTVYVPIKLTRMLGASRVPLLNGRLRVNRKRDFQADMAVF